jgi:hypothetical protein
LKEKVTTRFGQHQQRAIDVDTFEFAEGFEIHGSQWRHLRNARIENHQVNAAPHLDDTAECFADGLGIGDIERHAHDMSWKGLIQFAGQRIETFARQIGDGHVAPCFE